MHIIIKHDEGTTKSTTNFWNGLNIGKFGKKATCSNHVTPTILKAQYISAKRSLNCLCTGLFSVFSD